jgi:type I restriction enzyme S subunit
VINGKSDLPLLPPSWIWTTTSNVCSSVRDGTHETPKYVENGVPLVTSKNLKESQIDFSSTRNISLEDHQKISVRSGVEEGDVLFAMIGTIGNPVVVTTKDAFSIKNVALFKKNESLIKSKYLKHWLSNPTFNRLLEKKGLLKGTTQKFIPLENLRALPVPLAPLNEQSRIVDKVEALFSFLDAGADSLCTVQAQLKSYRQAVLKYAFEGKLTEEWRKTHKDQIESAQNLLEKVKQDLKITSPNKSAKIGANNESGFQELPETWTWTTIGELETFVGSGITPRGGRAVYVQEGIPFIRSQNVYPDGLRIEEIAYVTPKMHDTMKRTKAYPNDVLLNITGASIGRSAVIPEKLPEANVNQHVCIIRTGWWLIPAYLSDFLNSPIGQTQIFGTQSGVTRQGLNYEQVRRLRVPLAPLMEQKEIVVKIEAAYMAMCQVEKTIRKNIAHVEYLRQSILKDGFSGKLVPHDSNDEPAERLLDRIKSERVGNKKYKIGSQLELSDYVK